MESTKMDREVDGSGRHAEAISPPTSPPTRYTSPFSEMIDSSAPISMEHHPETPHAMNNEKKYVPGSPNPTDYSALEVVEQHPPQYSYASPPPGSPPPPNQYIPLNEKGQETQANEAAFPPPVEEPRILGMRKRTFYILLGFVGLLVLGVALGAGLGVGLNKKDDKSKGIVQDPFCASNPELCVGGALNAGYFSTKGAFNGSGIALAGESWNKDQRRIFTLYFQHHTGDIRYMQYTTDRSWIGGTKSETVATDAKNGTALSAVAYNLNSTQHFHLFYISKDSTVKQKTYSNDTDIWADGPLSSMNLKVYDSPSVGLQACWKGNYYGDSDYSKFPTASGQANNVPFENRVGINLWYASDESTFEQYAWYSSTGDTWVKLSPWQGKNTHAGVGCYSWGAGTTTYTMMVSKQNDTEIWWKDTNTTLTSEDTHPINSWTNSTSAAIDNVYPSTSLGYTTYFYAQMADRSVKGFNITYDAEKTKIEEDDFTITDPGGAVMGLGGTHLTCTAYALTEMKNNKTSTVWDSLYVFYQTEGSDITAFTRPIMGGEWTRGSLKIPDE